MADYKARESIGELGTSYAEEAKKSSRKKKNGGMPKGHRRHVKGAPNSHVLGNCSNRINSDSNEL